MLSSQPKSSTPGKLIKWLNGILLSAALTATAMAQNPARDLANASLEEPGYTRIDSRLGWHARENVEVSGGVQNLLDNRHAEFNGIDISVIPSQVRCSVYGRLTLRF